MTRISYHASHEQFKPSELLRYVQAAEKAGFTGALSSDHFKPWNEQQGESGFAWSWLGAAMQATQLRFGIVNAPGQRYHPAIIAQAAATLGELFPERFWIALGSGQALNEHITGDRWPSKPERNARLKASADIIRALWKGETVSHDGMVRVDQAKLYTLPKVAPLIVGAAITEETAAWVGSWADALITISHPHEQLKKVVQAFRENGGQGKPMFLKVQLSYASTDEEALAAAHREWRTNIFSSELLADLKFPSQFEAAGKFVQPAEMYDYVRISSDPERHLEWLRQDISLGFDELILHNVNRNQEAFIRVFGEKVLPRLAGASQRAQ